MKYTKQQKEDAYKTLKLYRHMKILAVISSVSRSGMSRRINFYCIIKDENDTAWLTPWIARLLDLPYNDNGLLVRGCGMDMIFHVLSNINYTMATLDGKYDGLKGIGRRIYDNYFCDANNYRLL